MRGACVTPRGTLTGIASNVTLIVWIRSHGASESPKTIRLTPDARLIGMILRGVAQVLEPGGAQRIRGCDFPNLPPVGPVCKANWATPRTGQLGAYPGNAKDSLTTDVNESWEAGEGDRTLDINLGKVFSIVLSAINKGFTANRQAACTAACTIIQDSVKAGGHDALSTDRLAILAAGISTLSEADRKRLLSMLAASLGADDV